MRTQCFYVGMRDGLSDAEDDIVLAVFQHPTFRICKENIAALKRQHWEFSFAGDSLVVVPITSDTFTELRKSNEEINLAGIQFV